MYDTVEQGLQAKSLATIYFKSQWIDGNSAILHIKAEIFRACPVPEPLKSFNLKRLYCLRSLIPCRRFHDAKAPDNVFIQFWIFSNAIRHFVMFMEKELEFWGWSTTWTFTILGKLTLAFVKDIWITSWKLHAYGIHARVCWRGKSGKSCQECYKRTFLYVHCRGKWTWSSAHFFYIFLARLYWQNQTKVDTNQCPFEYQSICPIKTLLT